MNAIEELLARQQAREAGEAAGSGPGSAVLADALTLLHTASSGRTTQVLLPANTSLLQLEEVTLPTGPGGERWEVVYAAYGNAAEDLLEASWFEDGERRHWERYVPNAATDLTVTEARTYHRLRTAGLPILEAHRSTRRAERMDEPVRSTYLTLLEDGTPVARAHRIATELHERTP